jgi:peptidoglycan/xylan/chitin deacetylase (PgdA/CDA1 family)
MRDERSVRLPEPEFRRQLAQVNDLLSPHREVRWVRPGSGWFTPGMLRAAADHDLRIVLGTLVATNDGGPGDDRIAASLAAATRRGSIVVLHEGTERRQGVVRTTDRLLVELSSRGLAAVTVSELVALRHPRAPGRPRPPRR